MPFAAQRIEKLLELSFRVNTDKPAIQSPSSQHTYADIDAASKEIADCLQKAGVKPHEPILFVTDNLPQNLITMIGIWRAQCTAVPLDIHSSKDTILGILEKTKARYMIGIPYNLGKDDINIASTLVDLNVIKGAATLSSYEELNDAALVVFTSGSTGAPKGVILSHKGYCRKIAKINSLIPFSGADKVLIALKLTFSFGQWTSILSLCKGCMIHIVPKFIPSDILNIICNHNITKYPIVPSMMRLLLQENNAPQDKIFPSVLFMAGGEVLPSFVGKSFLKKFPASHICDIYGLTETNSADFILLPEDYADHAGTIGKETPGVTAKIVKSDGSLASTNETGELQILTDFIMKGYIAQPDITTASFNGDYIKTGDLAYKDAAGFVHITGRLKDEINRGGNKVTPAEVENVYMQFNGIKLAACVAVKDNIMGEKILLAYEGDDHFNHEDLKGFGIQKLEKYKVPDYFKKLDAIPLGKTGKLNRAALRAELYNTYEDQ